MTAMPQRRHSRFPWRAGAGLRAGAGILALAFGLCGCGSAMSGGAATVEAPSGSQAPVYEPDTVPGSAGPEGAGPDGEPEPAGTQPADPPVPAVLGQGTEPAHLWIPAIELEEDLIGLGLHVDGSMEVPSDWDEAGWFTGGGRPGGQGPTVIAGHVDSLTGPAVFYRLTELEVGDPIEVTDVDGAVHHYEVYRVDDLPKDDYPTDEVFGARNIDELRLITCTGTFDPAAMRHLDNRVVFAVAATD